MDHASTIEERLTAMKVLHDAGIYKVLFMSPIFPYITEYKEIIASTRDFVKEYWFENLNLRGAYKNYFYHEKLVKEKSGNTLF